MVNETFLLGNTGHDPEVRATSGGTMVAKVSLATSRQWRDKASGEKREETEWHRLTFFGKLAEVVERYVKKGDRLFVRGRLHYSTTEKDGHKQYWTEIIVSDLKMLSGRRDEDQSDDRGGGEAHAPTPSTPPDHIDDDLPF